MHVVHVLNCGTVSGPEMLVVPELSDTGKFKEVWNLRELRSKNKDNHLQRICSSINLPLVNFNISSRIDIRALCLLALRIRSLPEKAIVHTHDVKASIYVWLAKMCSRKKNIHLVATHHGAMVRPNKVSRLYEMVFVALARYHAELFLCVSESELKILISRGMPKKILRLHRNGVERPLIGWTARRASMQKNSLKLVMVSRLSPEKNHSRAIDVLRQFKCIHPLPWQLDIMGEGLLYGELSEKVSRAGLQNQVNFLGYIPNAWTEFDSYDCLLSFSTGEAMPITLLEAGWRCTPVFASNVGGVPEVLGNTGGQMFDLQESDNEIALKLQQFVSNESFIRSAAVHLQQRVVDRYSGHRWRSELLQHYESLIGEKK